ncbi:MAG: Conserved rane protein [Cryobacterium sp.]|jgi:hypothetical protein|nr:Conserved rane protein [Cryobacterium sp.]
MSAIVTITPTAPLPTSTTRLHLTPRGRAVFTTLAATPLIIAALAFAINDGGAFATSDSAGITFDYVTIQSGQSLWQLAESVAPSADPRDVIAEIVSLNQLPAEDVQPGQRLALPSSF